MMKNFFSFFFADKISSSSSVKKIRGTNTTHKNNERHQLSNFIIIIMLRKGVNNSRSKLSLSVMKKDKSKNSTYILVNQVRFHLRFCCVFFVFLSSLSSSRLMMMRLERQPPDASFCVLYITHNSKSTSTR